jgi:hypothetical protein
MPIQAVNYGFFKRKEGFVTITGFHACLAIDLFNSGELHHDSTCYSHRALCNAYLLAMAGF